MPYESGNEMVFDTHTVPLDTKPQHPSNHIRNKVWYDRGQYANILRGLIASQSTQYKREKNRIKKTRIAQSVGYLIQILASLINSEKHLDDRITDLEQRDNGR